MASQRPDPDFALFQALLGDLASEFQEAVQGDATGPSGLQPSAQQEHPGTGLFMRPSLPSSSRQLLPSFATLPSYPVQDASLVDVGIATMAPWAPLYAPVNCPPVPSDVPSFLDPSSSSMSPGAAMAAAQGMSMGAGSRSASGRKRSSTTADQLSQLVAKVQVQQTIAKNLAQNNIWLAERMRIIEQVIKAADDQTIRLQAVKEGLTFDPMVGLHTSLEALRTATPQTVATFILDVISAVTTKMAAVEPLLKTNPHLVTEASMPPIFKPSAPGQTLTPNEDSDPILPPLKDTQYEHMLPDLKQMLIEIHRMCISWSFLYLTKPELLQAGSVRLQAMQGSNEPWSTLLSSVQKDSDLPESVPAIATEVQWRDMASTLLLSDKQRLRLAVLWDIVDGGRKTVHKQRAQLAANLTQLFQTPHSVLLGAKPSISRHSVGSATGSSMSLTRASSSGWQPPQQGYYQHMPHTALPGPLPPVTEMGSVPQLIARRMSQEMPAALLNSERPRVMRSLSTDAVGLNAAMRVMEQEAKAAVWKSSEAIQREMQLVEKLQHTLIKERCLILLGCEVMFSQIFSPIQKAMIMVSCYPYMPDQMAILHAAAAEFQPDVLERLVTAAHPDWA